MDLDFYERFEQAVKRLEEAGRDYAEKKGQAYQAQELKSSVLAQEMKKLPSDWAINRKEAEARISTGFLAYVKETASAIKAEGIAKAVYEKERANFEALRSLISLEKHTRQIIGE